MKRNLGLSQVVESGMQVRYRYGLGAHLDPSRFESLRSCGRG